MNNDNNDNIDINLAPPINPSPEQVSEALSKITHTVVVVRPPSDGCDFCCGPKKAWVYPTTGMETLAGPICFLDPTPWNACEDCAALIEADRYTALVERHLDCNPPSPANGARVFQARTAQALYAAFKKARRARVTLTEGQA